jgi:hypothetical protein
MQLKQVETERRMARTQGGRASRDILLERQALHLAADIQLVGEARARLAGSDRTASKEPGVSSEADAPSRAGDAGRAPTRVVAGS